MTEAEFDEQVYNSIAKYGLTTLTQITRRVSDPCVGASYLAQFNAPRRVVDKALQRLRKGGRITFKRVTNWSTVEVPTMAEVQ